MKTTAEYIRQNAASKKAVQEKIDAVMEGHKRNGFMIVCGIVVVAIILLLI